MSTQEQPDSPDKPPIATPHQDQTNVPKGFYRAIDGRMLFKAGEWEGGSGRIAGSFNHATPFLEGTLKDSDWEWINKLSRNDLLNLIRRVSGSIWGYWHQSPEEREENAVMKLYAAGMNTSETHKMIPAFKEYFDRTKGKPAQSISMDVSDNRMDKLPIDKLMRLASMLDEPVVIAPMPKDD